MRHKIADDSIIGSESLNITKGRNKVSKRMRTPNGKKKTDDKNVSRTRIMVVTMISPSYL